MNAIALVEIGKVKGPHPARWLFPIQSFRQGVSFFAPLGMVGSAFLAIGKFIVHELPPLGVILGMLAGSVPVLVRVLPSRFIITVNDEIKRREIIGFIEDKARRYGYKNKTVDGRRISLSPKLPRILVWDENTVHVEEGDETITVVGPIAAVKYLHKATENAFRS
jgi:hypothetical protein